MINEEEAEAFFNNQDKELKNAVKREQSFIDDLETQLIKVAFDCYPEFENRKEEIVERIKPDVHEAVIGVNDLLSGYIHLKMEADDERDGNYNVPYKNEIEFEELYKKREYEFLMKCHEKVKEMITIYYPEFMELSGNTIRQINFMAYCSMLNPVTGFIFVVYNEDV
jgi:hypothetical protein